MKHRPLKAFTLVELLIVIGIIVVLIAIVTLGIRSASDSMCRHETAIELKICNDMLTEYEGVNGLNGIEGPQSQVVAGAQPMNLPYPPWLNRSYPLPIYVDSSPQENVGQAQGSALGTVDFAGNRSIRQGEPPRSGDFGDMSDASEPNGPRWTSRCIYNMQGIMFLLLKNPANRKVISSIPAKRILETWPPQNPGDPPQPAFTIDAAIPLDGWENPIIYVPRGGMHVFMNPSNNMTSAGVAQPQEYVVRTSGTYLVKSGVPAVGPNDRPFFASSGRDRYFTDLTPDVTKKTDRSLDNIYSFQER